MDNEADISGNKQSITQHIAFTDQTNPNKFPKKPYQPYPYMMVNNKTGKPFATKQGKPVIVHNEDEEADFRKNNKDCRERPVRAADMGDALADLRTKVAALEAENARLAAGGAAKQPTPSIEDLAEAGNGGNALSGLAAVEAAAGAEPEAAKVDDSKPSTVSKNTDKKPGRRLD